ncbi:HK97 gp10 family phage protein [Aeromicrobium fastidiosum]|uniref:HK97 gp10 family phage protein n=1 Tax=Aeromicrobium fastidiosum TaxID=52699 RepID=A0A641AU17_9ACTN|nr:HK97 gp10 family phage protein [Aeromicrobium fastidiosum]KAA1380521.1 HK97 gp10 family phage protein [Aeromicrobium fastidiosum]MBP2390113.1 hypothetical protein [Aeromicrobium fastidiosum]
MATTAITRVVGADKLRAGLKATGDDLEDAKEVHLAIAKVVADAADLPVGETGRTAASLRPGATKRASIVRAGKASLPGVQPDHYGWPARNIRENPWLVLAGQGSESTWYPLYERYVERSLDKIKGATG